MSVTELHQRISDNVLFKLNEWFDFKKIIDMLGIDVEIVDRAQVLINTANRYESSATLWSWVIIFGTLGFLAGHLYGWNEQKQISLIRNITCISFIFLVVGVVAPILTLVESHAVPVIGKLVLKFDSKSILGMIDELWYKNIVLSILLVLFTILTPVAKTVLTYLALVKDNIGNSYFKITKIVGKWSMVDVFATAIVIIYYSRAGEEFNKVWHGFYFFVGYCILSIIGVLLLTDYKREQLEHTDLAST